MLNRFNSFILESISPETEYLYRYLNMSEEEKKENLGYIFGYLLDAFVEETDTDFPHLNEYVGDFDNLKSDHPEIAREFCEWLYDMSNKLENVDPQSMPTWHFFGKPQRIRNEWLIHFSDDAQYIAKEGFTHGVDDIQTLGLIAYIKKEYKKNGGYNFGYRIDDFERYGSNRYGNYKYGKEAVIFVGSGVKAWHYGDEEPQVIFYGKHINPKNIFLVFKDSSSGDWVLDAYGRSGNPLCNHGDLPKIADWLERNHDIYRKALRKK